MSVVGGKARGRDQCVPIGPGHHDCGHLAVAGDHGHQAIVQFAFACDHRIVAEIAEQIVHPAAEQEVGIEHARRLFVGDRKRTQQTAFASCTVPRQASQPPPASTSSGSRTDATTSPRIAHGARVLPLLSLIPGVVPSEAAIELPQRLMS